MKLSFSVPSAKHQSKPKPVNTFDDSSAAQNHSAAATKHRITEFDPSKPAPATAPQTLIPPIQNEWRPHKKMKNIHLPTSDPESEPLQFVPHTDQDQPGSDMSYGLNLRTDKKAQLNDQDNAAAPLRRVPPEVTMLQKFKDDLQRLPEDQGFDEFKDVAVEGFGAALLAGYGWKEGMGIGKNAKEDVKVIQIKRRTDKEGLGFVGDAPAALIRSNKDKDNDSINRESKNKEKNGEENGKSMGKNESEKEKKKKKEKVVRIVGGRDAGLKGSVVSSTGDGYLVLRLSGSGEKVEVKVGDVAELGSKEEERCLRKLKDKGFKSKRGRNEVEEKRRDAGRRVVDHRKVSWLTSHIRVRVISRDLKGGRLYLKKGEVLDVVGPTTCDISMDESRELVQGVSQDVLETAIPRCGGAVLVLAGKYKGVYGSLVERDLDRESAVVRDADTHELFNVKLEQIAEYTGDPSLLGH
ncbi:hypothetical protein Fmac_007319 [Flemingia macrophylla]|uniref:G-patch domain-containing protein n=1 Tax=Flemingia macrophylla TaxID=520843 RepID=A0ABD1MU84_9FABA